MVSPHSTASGDGQFARPGGVATDSHDNVYVADTNNQRIQVFKSDGEFITEWGEHRHGRRRVRLSLWRRDRLAGQRLRHRCRQRPDPRCSPNWRPRSES